MAFDDALAGRICTEIGRRRGLTEKKMFGGIAFLLNGNTCCGVQGLATVAALARWVQMGVEYASSLPAK